MPELQSRGGRPIRSGVTVGEGGSVALKAIPVTGERLPLAARIAGPGIAAVDNLVNRAANFAAFSLRGLAAGTTRLELSAASGGAPLIVRVTVQARMALPAAGTDAGLLARLLIAETRSPIDPRYVPGEVVEAMTLMRLVLENRRRTPSGRWSSAGVTSLADVVRARGQFAGFNDYPTLPAGITRNIDDMVRIANDASDPRQPAMRTHIEAALAVANGASPSDPTTTGLYWWRTKGSGAPGTGVSEYKSLLGNTFYREGR